MLLINILISVGGVTYKLTCKFNRVTYKGSCKLHKFNISCTVVLVYYTITDLTAHVSPLDWL